MRVGVLDVGAFAALALLLTILGTNTFHLRGSERPINREKYGYTFAARHTVHARAPLTTGDLGLGF
jgi:hypothetical protein